MADKGFSTILTAQKAPTRGGSVARHSRAEWYCDCDHSYELLDTTRKTNLVPWWKKVSEKPIVSMSSHTVLMKVCLKYLEEYYQYLHFAYVSRYIVTNDTDIAWVRVPAHFSGIPTFQEDGWDMLAFLLLSSPTIKNRIHYDSKMIDIRLEADVTTRGEAMVIIPSLAPGASCWIDIYSYYRPAGV